MTLIKKLRFVLMYKSLFKAIKLTRFFIDDEENRAYYKQQFNNSIKKQGCYKKRNISMRMSTSNHK